MRVAYLLILAVSFGGLFREEQLRRTQDARNRHDVAAAADQSARATAIATENHRQFCTVSRQRWVVQHAVIVQLARPIMVPPDTPANVDFNNRTRARNADFAARGAVLFALLGPEPPLC